MASQGNVALAFGLVIAAGACTCLGALLVFCSNLANPKWLSGSLGASAGVMIYVSFVEILSTKAVAGFEEAGFSDAQAQRYACFSFFAGLMSTWLVSKAVGLIGSAATALSKRKARQGLPDTLPQHSNPSSGSASAPVDASIEIPDAHSGRTQDRCQQPGSCPTAAGKGVSAAITAAAGAGAGCSSSSSSSVPRCKDTEAPADSAEPEDQGSQCCCASRLAGSSSPAARQEAERNLLAVLSADNHGLDLARMGVLTGLAVGLHNVPEGVATFAAALASPATGVVIAIAIALHNIPEGVAVALPLYYATGSKWKGLMWATISGAAEPLGGLIGYAVLSSTGMSQLAFGVMFSFVAGMMVYISIRELLPTAVRYDPKDSCATACAFWGMAIMAASLLLFKVNE